MEILDKFRRRLLSFVYPPNCILCRCLLDYPLETENAELGSSESQNKLSRQLLLSEDCHFCEDCFNEVTQNLIDRCNTCGAILRTNNPFGLRCARCRDLNVKFDRAISVGDYCGVLQNQILAMKREYNDVLALQFGRLLASLLDKFDIPGDIDWVIPIPVHWRRKMNRKGFHAADILCEGLCSATGYVRNNRILRCLRSTAKQGTMTTRQRFQNVKGAFGVRVSKRIRLRRSAAATLNNRKILLLDDVMTSGATINEAAKVLKRSGAAKVFVAVVARGAGVS